MTQSDRSVLLGQIAHLQMLDREAPLDEHPLFSSTREQRIVMLEREVAALEQAPDPASVIITFEGASVTGSSSIGVTLFTRTMAAFREAVGLVVGSIEELPTTRAGRPRSGNVDHIQLTSVAHGSFGYELVSRNPDGLFDVEQTRHAIRESLKLFEAAATDEEAFFEHIENYPAQLLAKMKSFLSPIKSDKGSVRFVTATTEIALDRDEVLLAYVRIANTVKGNEVINLEGVFRGALLDSRRFEFEASGEAYGLLKGSIDDELDEDQIAAFDKEFISQRVTGVFRVLTVKRLRGAEKKSWVLLDVRGR